MGSRDGLWKEKFYVFHQITNLVMFRFGEFPKFFVIFPDGF